MNKITLIGNLTRNPELTTTPNGKNVCKFAIAVNRRFAGANGERDVDYFNIVVWNAQGENAAKYLVKGNKVAIVGAIEFREYEKDGVKRMTHNVTADEVEYLTPKGNSQGGENAGVVDPHQSGMSPVVDDSLPF